ncbi:MAG: helix-turn-helix transcriptional regulator [Phycisphaerae bacterium]
MMNVQAIELDGRRRVIMDESDYLKLLERAGVPKREFNMPKLPGKLPGGGYPALEYAKTSLARDIIRTRRRLGLSQVELARRAAIPPETLCRIEKARHNTTIAMAERIDQALKAAEIEFDNQTERTVTR